MKYYSYVDIDYLSVLESLQRYVIKIGRTTKNFWSPLDEIDLLTRVPRLSTIFEPLNLTIVKMSLVSLYEPEGRIHIDINPAPIRINIPIFNCEDSQTRFFTYTGQIEQKHTSNGTVYSYLDSDQCTHVDTLILNRPAALQTQVPHQVIAGKKIPRISLTIRFEQPLDFLLL